ncbi:MAG: bifunctional 5,10-methylenetetrahydrofolate dehydrogenase/5,10-methenyltetrahydrofolate cyclohydrolase [Acidobacteria bacterium]|nr:MAG: bifunctional 5,10-methylenetetrahydrofolate dehydrogenase/5,10-methenyltetrahydrofolate cyclohydrolase [Acidobacteriota bacterium]
MSAKVLDGTAAGAAIRSEVGERVRAFSAHPPGLAVILAGDNAASAVYVRAKIRACNELGIFSEQILRPASVSTAELLDDVARLNARDDIDGILVQLPLPPQVDAAAVLLAVAPEKDVDGFHPVNLGKLVTGRPGPRPCTPAGIMELLRRNQIAVAGREAVVVGRSDIVGKPLALLLLHANATVTLCHSKTRNLPEVCQRGELLFAAIGRAAMLGERHIRRGAVVVDVGVNTLIRAEDVETYFPGSRKRREEFDRRGRTLIGDVDPRAACALASAFTPVPGGVGPLTIAMLMSNTVDLAAARRGVAVAPAS